LNISLLSYKQPDGLQAVVESGKIAGSHTTVAASGIMYNVPEC
jgi:hypothetical protein